MMLQAMGSFLREGDLVVDVGANIGNHTLYLAMVVGCRVIAFEPNPLLLVPLNKTIALNDIEDRVSLVSKGVGAAEARGVFSNLNPTNLGAQSITLIDQINKTDHESVEVIPLDGIAFEGPVKALKIDVEGMELDVLQGAMHLIENNRPHLFIESHDEEQFVAVHAALEQWGYVYWRTFNATPTNWFVPIEFAARADLQSHGLEQARAFYKLWQERQNLRHSLGNLHKEYGVLQSRLAASNRDGVGTVSGGSEHGLLKEKGESLTANRDVDEGLNDEGLDFEPKVFSNQTHIERALGLNFSLAEPHGQVKAGIRSVASR
jgi:FkbM family methyltransferase